MKLVSVVVATYRRNIELKRALCSLAVQTYSNIEIILVDDNGSKEWNRVVLDIVEEFKEVYSNISLKLVVNSPNRGSAIARNVGIKEANGEYITFLDDDDLYLPNKVERQVEFMERIRCDYSITDLILYNENEKEIDKRSRSYIQDTSVESLRIYHLMYHITGTDTMMFKKEYLIKIGGFAPIDVGDEFYLMQRAIEGRGIFGYLPCCDVKAYVHTGEGSLSSGDGKIKGENTLYQYKKKFFDKIDKKSIRYIRMRHYAVLAFAELRRTRYFYFILNAIKSFFSSPIDSIKLIIERKL